MKKIWITVFLLAACTSFACRSSEPSSTPGDSNLNANLANNNSVSEPSSSAGFNLRAPLKPDPRLTPGDTLDVTKQDICTPGYSKKVRDVPQAVKEEAYREYGITSRLPREYEVDHLISLELGGSNSIKNLWPQSFQTESLNAHVKDKLENKLHEMICNGQIDMKTAQHDIATDWVAAYQKYVGSEPAKFAHDVENTPRKEEDNSEIATRETNSAASSSRNLTTGVMIGNKKSHVYHREDCPDYQKVSQINRIEFKSAKEAEAAGYHLAGNCPK